ncbi:MAG: cyclic pyranopterin monophosphate synthase MoaC [Gammaproteobacteria bacterium]|jgi:cyclic pyranopterin phosphate synthase|nr:cyclic pyranopterin monophosphate synthase MoaC [Gammaproteobacteria bacterium]|tara:strand:+ start:8999 stop:9472 length:474 start_codon:yes stop_codon:yes gene_type:complete
MKKSNHIDRFGDVKMVDVSNKSVTKRTAVASGTISLSKKAINSIKENVNKKGDVLIVAQVAGIQAAKKTSAIIPLAHQINLKSIQIKFEIKTNKILCITEVVATGKTGVEIESILATQISLLTIYDMCKYIDRSMIISNIELVLKKGGKSGTYNINK